jgi:hypothetical protein
MVVNSAGAIPAPKARAVAGLAGVSAGTAGGAQRPGVPSRTVGGQQRPGRRSAIPVRSLSRPAVGLIAVVAFQPVTAC